MSDRETRSDRLAGRFDDETDSGGETPTESDMSDETSKPSSKSKTDMIAKTGGEVSVKDRPSVLMYLPEELRRELDIRFDELNARYKREHGEAIEKNRDWYPAVVKAGLSGDSVEDVLDI